VSDGSTFSFARELAEGDETLFQVAYVFGRETDRRLAMAVRINDVAPDFTAESTAGTIRFHEWLGDSYGIVFSHPRDFTPVCTTEFGAVAQLAGEWAKRNTKVLGVSVDSVGDHQKWKRDIEAFGGAPADFPIIDDSSLTVAKAYDMLPADYYLPTEGRTPAHSATVRTVYIIGPDKKVRLTMTYPMSVGRNFAEILRALDAVRDTSISLRGVPSGFRVSKTSRPLKPVTSATISASSRIDTSCRCRR
jgi:thioredoxin-dependent peroxiredoxin